jgi:hypothetical protein
MFKESQTTECQIATATMEGPRNGGSPDKRRKDKGDGDLNIMELKNGQATARHHQEWRKTVLEATVHSRLCCVR